MDCHLSVGSTPIRDNAKASFQYSLDVERDVHPNFDHCVDVLTVKQLYCILNLSSFKVYFSILSHERPTNNILVLDTGMLFL